MVNFYLYRSCLVAIATLFITGMLGCNDDSKFADKENQVEKTLVNEDELGNEMPDALRGTQETGDVLGVASDGNGSMHAVGDADSGSQDKHLAEVSTVGEGQSGGPNGSVVGANDDTVDLEWMWECESVSSVPESGSAELTNAKSANIHVSGHLCDPSKQQKNIMFLIDVSKSMVRRFIQSIGIYKSGADEAVDNSCGRLQAVNSVLDKMQNGEGLKFGLVTFSDKVIFESDGFLPRSEFIRQAATFENICHGVNATNYDAPIRRATALFDAVNGTVGQNQGGVVYFVSDGEPSVTGSVSGAAGIEAAKELRQRATVVTLMLDNSESDAVMRDKIASRDENDKPYHTKVTNTAEMVQVFSRFAEAQFVGLLFGYRVQGDLLWTYKDATASVGNDLSFSLTLDELSSFSSKALEGRLIVRDSAGMGFVRNHVLRFK